jgi:hypothetical protein
MRSGEDWLNNLDSEAYEKLEREVAEDVSVSLITRAARGFERN